MREHSEQELRNKLSALGSEEELNALLLQLQNDDLQSDDRYTEAYIRMRSQRGYGAHRIIQELQQRGISRSMAQQIIDQSEIDWGDLAKQAYAKKFGTKKPENFNDQQKRKKYLFDRGFQAFDWLE